jgi:curved DNA-binding protein CbpA
MEGQLQKHPLGELMREISQSGLSGALRLSRGPAKVVLYFLAGETVFAASNLRAHRLREALKRSRIPEAELASVPDASSEDELASALIKSGALTRASLQAIRARVVREALRTVLIWSDGHWMFDPRVRVPNEMRMKVEVPQLLLESARHLPLALVKSRFNSQNTSYAVARAGHTLALTSGEEFILSRAIAEANEIKFADLAGGLSEEESLRGVYGLSLSGALVRSEWPLMLSGVAPQKVKEEVMAAPVQAEPADTSEADTETLLERVQTASDHYQVLGLPQAATAQEIKDCYHVLARNFHPDRFHQSAPELRSRIESAFARIAQSYEILSDVSRRSSYDRQLLAKIVAAERAENGSKGAPGNNQNRAENSFRLGMDALKHNRRDDAIRYFAEAAHLAPKEARFRAYYGSALSHRTNARRTAEAELHAALTLEPNNALFRLMLAELYKSAGLRHRAQNEAARALAADPKNEAARALLSSLNAK